MGLAHGYTLHIQQGRGQESSLSSHRFPHSGGSSLASNGKSHRSKPQQTSKDTHPSSTQAGASLNHVGAGNSLEPQASCFLCRAIPVYTGLQASILPLTRVANLVFHNKGNLLCPRRSTHCSLNILSCSKCRTFVQSISQVQNIISLILFLDKIHLLCGQSLVFPHP